MKGLIIAAFFSSVVALVCASGFVTRIAVAGSMIWVAVALVHELEREGSNR